MMSQLFKIIIICMGFTHCVCPSLALADGNSKLDYPANAFFGELHYCRTTVLDGPYADRLGDMRQLAESGRSHSFRTQYIDTEYVVDSKPWERVDLMDLPTSEKAGHPSRIQAMLDRRQVVEKTIEVEFQAEIGYVASKDEGFRKVVEGLKARAMFNGVEQEVGAVSLVLGGRRHTFYFSSRNSGRILARHHRQAMRRMMRFLYEHIERSVMASGNFERDFTIERFHTHPSFVNLPHSGDDAIQDEKFRRWMRSRALLRYAKFRSFVIPLYYDGELYVLFDPSQHRIY